MNPTVLAKLDSVQRKPAVADLRPERKELAVCWKQKQGDVFARVLELGRMTQHDASWAMGYTDQSAVSRWVSAVDRVQWDKVAGVDRLRKWIPIAWGEATGAETLVSVSVRSAA